MIELVSQWRSEITSQPIASFRQPLAEKESDAARGRPAWTTANQETRATRNTATRITTRTDEIPGTNSKAGMTAWATRNRSSQPQGIRFVGGPAPRRDGPGPHPGGVRRGRHRGLGPR